MEATRKRLATLDDYPGYMVSDHGEVFTRHNNRWGISLAMPWRPMKPTPGSHGYYTVKMKRADGTQRTECVHILVLRMFKGPAGPNQLCRHLDGNKKNNHIDNLEWGTQKENLDDQLLHGTRCRGVDRHSAKVTDDDVREMRRLYSQGVFQRILAARYGLDQSTVSDIVNRRTWTHIEA